MNLFELFLDCDVEVEEFFMLNIVNMFLKKA